MRSRVHASTCTHVCMHTPWDRDHSHTPLTQAEQSTCIQLTHTHPLQHHRPTCKHLFPLTHRHARTRRNKRQVSPCKVRSDAPYAEPTPLGGKSSSSVLSLGSTCRYSVEVEEQGGKMVLGKAWTLWHVLSPLPFLRQEEMGELLKPVTGGLRTPGRTWPVSLEFGEHLQGRRCWLRRGGEEGAELGAASTQALAGESTRGHFPWTREHAEQLLRLSTERPRAAMTSVMSGQEVTARRENPSLPPRNSRWEPPAPQG